MVLTGGKKLRSEHYLDKLPAEALEQLRLALSCSGTFAEQQKLCPPRQGGDRDGGLPGITTLGEIAQAMRQVTVLRELERRGLVEAAAKRRCGELGFNSQLTNAVVSIVGEEALKEHAAGVVDKFALKAANVLIKREGQIADHSKEAMANRTTEEKALELCLAESKKFPDVAELFKSAFAALKKARGK